MTDSMQDALWVAESETRANVLDEVDDGPVRPSAIVEATGLSFPQVSRALSELRKRGYVELVATSGRARLYDVTEAGEEVWDDVEQVGAE